MSNRLFHVMATWRDGEWRATTEIEGHRFAASVPSDVSDPSDDEALEPVKDQLAADLGQQIEDVLRFPRQQTGVMVSCVDRD